MTQLLGWADSCRSFLREQKEIRVFVEDGKGRGHQASSITLLHHLIRIVPLSGATTVTLVCRNRNVPEQLAGFLPSLARPDAALAGVPLRLRMAEEIRREPWVELGCTGASDSTHDLLPVVRSRSFLWMHPFRWGNPERIHFRERGVTTRDALTTHPWTADLGCDSLAFALPPPVEPDWESLPQTRSLQVVRAALAAGRRPDVALFPVYGMDGESTMGASHVLLRNVLLGAQDALRRGLAAAVLVLDLSPAVQPEAISPLRRALDSWDEGLGKRICTEVEEPPDSIRAKIAGLARGGLLLVHAGGYKPQAVFDYVLSQAKLPFVFEGAGTASRAVTLGRPFLQASNLSFKARQLGRQPRSFEIAYPFLKGRWPLRRRLQRAADSVLFLQPEPSLLGSVLLDCAHGDAALLGYFAALAADHGDPRHDRLLWALGLYELLRRHRDLRGLGPVPRWEWDPINGTRDEP